MKYEDKGKHNSFQGVIQKYLNRNRAEILYNIKDIIFDLFRSEISCTITYTFVITKKNVPSEVKAKIKSFYLSEYSSNIPKTTKLPT